MLFSRINKLRWSENKIDSSHFSLSPCAHKWLGGGEDKQLGLTSANGQENYRANKINFQL